MAIDNGKLIIDIDGDTKELEQSLGRLDKIGGAALTALAAGVAGLGAALASSVVAGASFESQMSAVEAISGATASQMETLTAKAKQLGIDTAFSATQAGQAFQYMAQAGWDTESMLNGISGVMDLAAASGEDLALVSDIVTDAMTAFRLEADQAGRFADVLAQAAASSNTDVAKMGYTFKYVGNLAGSFGFQVEDMALAIGLMANTGLKGEQAGTGLRAIMSRLAKPTKESAEAMDVLGLSLTNADGTMKSFYDIMQDMRAGFKSLDGTQRQMYAGMLGGQEAMGAVLAIAESSDVSFANLAKQINNAAGAAARMAAIRLDNLSGQFTLLKSSLEGVQIAIYSGLAEPLTDGVKQAIVALNSLNSEISSNLQPSLHNLGVAAGGVFSGIVQSTTSVLPTLISLLSTLLNNLDFLAIAFLTLKARAILTSTAVTGFATSLRVANTQMVGGIMVNVSRTNALLTTMAATARAAGASLLAALGGPVGVAVTALGLGIGYLVTKETEAEAAARSLAEAQNAVDKALQDSAKSAKEYTAELGAAAKLSREIAQEKAQEALAQNWLTLRNAIGETITAQQDWLITKDQTILKNADEIAQLREHATTINELGAQLQAGEISSKEFEDAIAELIAELKAGDEISKKFAASLTNLFSDGFFANVSAAYNALKSVVDLQAKAANAPVTRGHMEADLTLDPNANLDNLGGTAPSSGGGGKSARTTQLDQEAEAARRLTDEIQRAQMTDAAYSQWKISQEVSKLTAEYPNLTAKVKEWEQAQLQALRTGLVEDMQQTVNNIKQFNAELASVATGSQEELKLKKDVDAAWLKLQAFKTDLANIDTQINQAGGIIPQLDPELIRAQHAGSAYQIGANISEDVGTGVSDSWGNIGSGISSALSSALKGEKSWGEAFADLGINLMEGLVGGLWDSAQSILTDALKSIGSYIVKAFSGFMGIASPSKVFAELGYWTMAGYAEGLADSASMAMKPLSGLKSSMTGALSGVDMGALKASMLPSAGFALAGAGAGGGVAVNIVNKTSAQITDTQTSVSYDNNGNMQLDMMVADAAVSKITQTGSRQERAISRKFGMKSQPIKR